MWSILLSLFAKGNGAKVGAAALGGTGILTLVLSLHNDLSTKIEDQKKEQREYVELVLKPINIEMKYQHENIKETKKMVTDIHSYLLERK